MDSSFVSLTVTVEREEDLGGASTYHARVVDAYGDSAGGKSTHSPALAAAEAIGNHIDAHHTTP